MGNKSLAKNIVLIGVVVFIGYIFSNLIAKQDLKKFIFLIAPFALAISVFYWRGVLLFIPFWVLVEGYVRRNYFPSFHILFIKDFLLLGVYLRFFLMYFKGNVRLTVTPSINLILVVLLSWYLIELFNPNQIYILQGLVAIKVIFFYIPYLFLTKYIFKSKKELFRYLYIFLMASIPISIVAFLQYKAGPNSLHQADITFFDGKGNLVVRPAATFFYNSAFSHYSYFVFTSLLAVVNIKYFFKYKVILIAIIAANLMGIFLCAQRVLWVSLIFQASIYLLLGYNISRKFLVLFRSIAIISLAAILVLSIYPKIKKSTVARAQSIGIEKGIMDNKGIVQAKQSLGSIFDNSPILGNGPGTATPASRYLGDFKNTSLVEGGMFKSCGK